MHFTPQDSLRPKNWRWLTSEYLVDIQGSPAADEDKALWNTFNYYTKFRNITESTLSLAERDAAVQLLRKEYPYLYTAHEIYISNTYTRWALEAFIVAKMPSEDIAHRLPAHPEVVTTYENTFFDVRSRLGFPIFVINELVSPAMTKGVNQNNPDFFWKMIALTKGADMLEQWLAIKPMSHSFKTDLDNQVVGSMRKLALEALHVRSPDKYNAHDILTEYLDMRKMENESMHSSTDVMVDQADMLLSSMKLVIRSIENPPRLPVEGRVANAIKELAHAQQSVKVKEVKSED